MTDKAKEWHTYLLKEQAERLTRLCVVYNPDCGCKIDQFFVLDRYPMSKKIHSICPECKKGCLMEISDPIVFHLPLTKEDYDLAQLKEMIVMDGPQKHLIEAYREFCHDPH